MRKFKTALFEVACEPERLSLRPAWGRQLPLLALLAFCAIAGLILCFNGAADNFSAAGKSIVLLASLICLAALVFLLTRGRAPYLFDLPTGMLLHGNKVLSPLENIARIELHEESLFNITVYEVGFVRADDAKQTFHSLGSLTSTQPRHRDMEYIGQALVLFSPLPVVDTDGQTLSHAL
jgi:hypothetical protein